VPNDYRIGSVVEYRVGDTLRQCEVEERGWRDSEAQENDPTFDGQLVKDGKAASAAEPGLPATGVWGYDRQIIRVVKY